MDDKIQEFLNIFLNTTAHMVLSCNGAYGMSHGEVTKPCDSWVFVGAGILNLHTSQLESVEVSPSVATFNYKDGSMASVRPDNSANPG